MSRTHGKVHGTVAIGGATMTLSWQIAMECLEEKQGKISIHDLGFILTVIKDNAHDDEVYNILKEVLQEKF